MKVFWKIVANKYLIATILFLVFFLFLDDHDVFTIFQKRAKLKSKEIEKQRLKDELDIIDEKLVRIQDMNELERYAREKKYFKKPNEEIFVITNAKEGEFSE